MSDKIRITIDLTGDDAKRFEDYRRVSDIIPGRVEVAREMLKRGMAELEAEQSVQK